MASKRKKRGPGRPSLPPSEVLGPQIGVRLRRSILERLGKAARKVGVSRADFLREAGIKRIEEVERAEE